MLYIDQRGTGLSNPISAATLALQGDAEAQADYLKHFRADNIVRDCEAIRKILTADYSEELKKYVIIFVSFRMFIFRMPSFSDVLSPYTSPYTIILFHFSSYTYEYFEIIMKIY